MMEEEMVTFLEKNETGVTFGTQNPESFTKRARVNETPGDLNHQGHQMNLNQQNSAEKSHQKHQNNAPLPPEFPTKPCGNCGCNDYWLSMGNEWVCCRCHPEPKEKENDTHD